jgi:hypothetical protein
MTNNGIAATLDRLTNNPAALWLVTVFLGITIHMIVWQFSEPSALFSDFYKANYAVAETLYEDGLNATLAADRERAASPACRCWAGCLFRLFLLAKSGQGGSGLRSASPFCSVPGRCWNERSGPMRRPRLCCCSFSWSMARSSTVCARAEAHIFILLF